MRGARGRRLGAGVAAGLLLTASLPARGWWPLGPAGVAVLFFALSGGGWRGRLAAGTVAGLALYGPGLWWATQFHAAGWAVLVLVEAAMFGLFVAAVPAGRGAVTVVALPAALVVAEAVRGRWPFEGLPLAGLDLGQADGPLLPVARVGGHLAVVGVMAVAGVGLACLAGRRWRAAAGCLGLTVAAVVAGTVTPDGSDAGPLRVAAVQGGGVRGLRAVDADPDAVFQAHLAATRERVPPGSVALVVWPEDVVEVDGPLPGSQQDAEMARLADELGATIVAGVVEEVPAAARFRNAAVVWEPGRGVVDRYDKVHLVPFGEYVPFRSLVERVADVSDVPRDAIAGTGPGVLDTAAGRLGVLISYEVFFADRAQAAVTAGGRLLLVPTNASSYTTSQVPAQELAVARLRAVETGRWV
ncbi:MAG: apolipoprotein N-acyltransferase, partial [Actinomycetota bacterium]|nr:apolipoprotein N-acyltransferase [Actinomycetota bacterium]